MADMKNPSIQGTMFEALGIIVEEAGPDKVVLTMPVGPATRQPYGLLHGGASVALAETAASIGAHLNAAPEGKAAVGLEINANHIKPKRDGVVRARAIPLHKGSTTMVWDIKITDEKEKLVCVSRCTMAIIDIPGGENGKFK
ncbi:hotdog fold thioesterase [Desulfocucumis palustris]|nr:hotdog fold thioesterase [Desulfocucumis palustris]